jgi:hypothetical protein
MCRSSGRRQLAQDASRHLVLVTATLHSGICAFVDGPAHDDPNRTAEYRMFRAGLKDLGFRVIVIRHDRSLSDQFSEESDVFTSTT